jgi:outer membrane protein OmpA-like peptidoglycan-associated protein
MLSGMRGQTVRTSIGNRNVRRLASVMILPLLAFVALVVAGFGTREVAPEVRDTLSPVYFAAGTTQMRPRDMSILDGHAAWLRGDRKRILLIEGHTDEPGDSAFSRAVGDQRAQSVKAYLVSKGLAADRITTVSRGGGRPICEEKTPTCRALNRRASFSPGMVP